MKFILYLRALAFYIGFFGFTIIQSILCLPTIILPLPRRYKIITKWANICLWWLKVTCNVTFEVKGREQLPDTPCIVLSKHSSTWETIAFQLIFPFQTWAVKKELLRIPFFGWLLALLKPIRLDRQAPSSAMEQLLSQGQAQLTQGRWVIVFPEGRRVSTGETRKFARGGAVLAQLSQVPVVPVAHDAGDYWPRRGFLKKPGKIRVLIGPPIATQGKTPQQINDEAKNWIEQAMEKLRT